MNGSSPRAWGIRLNSERSNPFGAVHPHVRGVYLPRASGQEMVSGSSPRAWGIQAKKKAEEIAYRFIPTCVGYTRGCWQVHLHRSVHPHVRGVYGVGKESTGYTTGSSPRAWGIRLEGQAAGTGTSVHPHVRGVYGFNALLRVCHARFIPTCVGYTTADRFF